METAMQDNRFHLLSHFAYLLVKRNYNGMGKMGEIMQYLQNLWSNGRHQTKSEIYKELEDVFKEANTPYTNHRNSTTDFIITDRDSDKFRNQTLGVELANYRPWGCGYTYSDLRYTQIKALPARY